MKTLFNAQDDKLEAKAKHWTFLLNHRLNGAYRL